VHLTYQSQQIYQHCLSKNYFGIVVWLHQNIFMLLQWWRKLKISCIAVSFRHRLCWCGGVNKSPYWVVLNDYLTMNDIVHSFWQFFFCVVAFHFISELWQYFISLSLSSLMSKFLFNDMFLLILVMLVETTNWTVLIWLKTLSLLICTSTV